MAQLLWKTVKYTLTIWLSTPILGIYPRVMKWMSTQNHVHKLSKEYYSW
jgi:hypothetical protein